MSPPEPSTITAIEPQVKRRDRISIFVDREWVLGTHAEVAAAAGLRVGQPVTVPELQELARAEERKCAQESALNLLGYRARSRAELQRRLEQKGFEAPVVEEALAALTRGGWIDDAEFSQSWVRSRTGSRPMGRSRIAAELRQKGVQRETIDQALEGVNRDVELELALKVGRTKVEQMRGVDPQVARRKLGALLMRRGFGWEVCARVLDIVLQADG
jgi:regulatory protein